MQTGTGKRIFARMLSVVVITVLFLGSCGGAGKMYVYSPYWFMKEVDAQSNLRLFFVAFMTPGKDGNPSLQVFPITKVDLQKEYPDLDYTLPRDNMTFDWDSDSGAIIEVIRKDNGTRIVQVFVRGDTPWTSLSEYRVDGKDKVTPLRHGRSNEWFLLLALVLPVIVLALRRRISRLVYRVLSVSEKSAVGKDR
ncbi:MAG: hypothetical protein OEZ10_07930 [Gammaproteobacteria bacterium]|nr:hypothetical protein [Gammaproteobacteria bacterium]